MTDGDWPSQTTRTGTIDEMLKIAATAGKVSMSGGDPPHFGWTLHFPCAAIDELIKKLAAARDAAALMAERGD